MYRIRQPNSVVIGCVSTFALGLYKTRHKENKKIKY